MTGPLAQQFARVVVGLHSGCVRHSELLDALAALSAVERHVQDMEKERDFEQRRYINSFNENRALIRELRTLKDSVEAAGGE